jgi:hypothetical protein
VLVDTPHDWFKYSGFSVNPPEAACGIEGGNTGGTLVCELGAIAPDHMVTVTITGTVKVEQETLISNTATADPENVVVESNEENNSMTVTTLVLGGTPKETPTKAKEPTNTPTKTPTRTPTLPPCTPGNTGFRNPTANVADTGGDGDGFEMTPEKAYTNGAGVATNINGPGDRHRYLEYGFSVPLGCVATGIEVRVDWRLRNTLGANSLGIELSWDGGESWTKQQQDTRETTYEHAKILGGPDDAWGHVWKNGQTGDEKFRLRVVANCTGSDSCETQFFFLDWVPVRVHYGAP